MRGFRSLRVVAEVFGGLGPLLPLGRLCDPFVGAWMVRARRCGPVVFDRFPPPSRLREHRSLSRAPTAPAMRACTVGQRALCLCRSIFRPPRFPFPCAGGPQLAPDAPLTELDMTSLCVSNKLAPPSAPCLPFVGHGCEAVGCIGGTPARVTEQQVTDHLVRRGLGGARGWGWGAVTPHAPTPAGVEVNLCMAAMPPPRACVRGTRTCTWPQQRSAATWRRVPHPVPRAPCCAPLPRRDL
jgi:hypothetical protein